MISTSTYNNTCPNIQKPFSFLVAENRRKYMVKVNGFCVRNVYFFCGYGKFSWGGLCDGERKQQHQLSNNSSSSQQHQTNIILDLGLDPMLCFLLPLICMTGWCIYTLFLFIHLSMFRYVQT